MADPVKTEIQVDVDEAIRELKRLRGELGNVSGATEETGESAQKAEGDWGNFSQKITAGIMLFEQAKQMLTGLVAGLKDLGLEFERQAGIINRFSGDISKAEERTNGLFTSIDLMIAQQKAIQAGLNLTADEFATLSVAANESASALGGDNVQALNRLVQAMATGRSGALREFGIDIRGLTDASDIQAEVMRELAGTYGEVESKADTLGGKIIELDTAMANAKTEFFDGMNNVKGLNKEIDNLNESIQELRDTGLVPLANIDFPNANDAGEALAGGVGVLVRQFTRLLRTAKAIIDLDFGRALSEMGEFAAGTTGADLADIMGGNLTAVSADDRRTRRMLDAGAPETGFGSGPGFSGGLPTVGDLSPAQEAAQARRGRGRGGRGGGGSAAAEDPLAGLSDLGGDIAGESSLSVEERMAEERLELERETRSEMAKIQEEAHQEQLDRLSALEQRENELDKARAHNAREQEKRMQEEAAMQERITGAVASGGTKVLEAFGASEGQMELWKGAIQVAEAVGSYPDPVGIATHGLAATLHFANAAQMGVGGGGGEMGKLAQVSGGAAAPASGAPANNNGGGGSVINISFNAPQDEATMGRQQTRAQREARRRFGR